ncbi:6-phospho-3-hexuloisomerase [Halopolyspora algeriensis]|uniref:6-phospho-3-hexuloisomerase n=1 Tax=Halopolyspora algeriensis TaxID=1500506 RepID=A0A368VNV3_9ACTN|nr:6-phospho-3-hexuloisomerase [Halopolyspora algeriensis]RCW43200.1 6-phospho-3-hexuloisomerase [Halopolyspora algeriensis]TQM56259.1 6-phospho-3-hexuloisomerase [Halopolyspora algeriensis]
MSTDALDVIQAEIAGVLARVDRAMVERAAAVLDGAGRIFVAGAGRSGFMAEAFAMRLVHLGFRVHVVGETTAPSLASEDIVVAVSGSGTTAGTLRSAQEAVRVGGHVLAVTTDADSPLVEQARTVLLVPAATKHRRADETATVQPLSSLFDQSVHLLFDAVCLRLAELRDVDNTAARSAHVTTE